MSQRERERERERKDVHFLWDTVKKGLNVKLKREIFSKNLLSNTGVLERKKRKKKKKIP